MIFFRPKKQEQKQNGILLVFQYQEDAIQPELSSPARFRIQGGTLRVTEEKYEQRKYLCLIQDTLNGLFLVARSCSTIVLPLTIQFPNLCCLVYDSDFKQGDPVEFESSLQYVDHRDSGNVLKQMPHLRWLIYIAETELTKCLAGIEPLFCITFCAPQQ